MKEKLKALIYIEAVMFFIWGMILMGIFLGVGDRNVIENIFYALPIIGGIGVCLWAALCFIPDILDKW